MNKEAEEQFVFSSRRAQDPRAHSNLFKALGGAFLVSVLVIPSVLWATTRLMRSSPLAEESASPRALSPEFTSVLSFRNDSAVQDLLTQESPFFAEQIELPLWDPSEDFAAIQETPLEKSALSRSMELLPLPTRSLEGHNEASPSAPLEVPEIGPLAFDLAREMVSLESTVATLFLQVEGTSLQKIWPTREARSFEIPQGLELPTWPGVSMKVGVVGETGLVEFCAPLDDAVPIEKSRALTRWVKQLQFEKTPKHLVWGEVRIWQKQIKNTRLNPPEKTQ